MCELLPKQLGNRSSQCHFFSESTFCSRHRVFSRQQEASHRWLHVMHRCWLDSVFRPGIIAYLDHQGEVKESQLRNKNKASILLFFFPVGFLWSFFKYKCSIYFPKIHNQLIALDSDLSSISLFFVTLLNHLFHFYYLHIKIGIT